MATSDQLVEQTTRHQVYLEGLKTREANKMREFLVQVDESVRSRLSRGDITEFTRRRLNRLLKALNDDLDKVWGEYWEQLKLDLEDLGEYEAGFESRSLNAVLDNVETVVPTTNQINAAVFTSAMHVRDPGGGMILKDFVARYGRTQTERILGAVRQGYFEGQTNSEIIRIIRGTKAQNYADGILAISAKDSDAVVRTAVQQTASEARTATWDQNDDIITGYRWLATLDTRTTTECRSLDNQVFKMGDGPLPPIHYRCRSTTAAEIDGRFGFSDSGERASMDGPVNADLTYYQWLKRQPAEFQDDVLGPTRGKLFRDGGLSANDFARLQLGRNYQPLTLEQMREREPVAFRRAFGSEAQ